jgi:hypothetical protein
MEALPSSPARVACSYLPSSLITTSAYLSPWPTSRYPYVSSANISFGSIAKLALGFNNGLILVADGYLHDSITHVCSAPVVGDYVLLALRTSKDDSGVT